MSLSTIVKQTFRELEDLHAKEVREKLISLRNLPTVVPGTTLCVFGWPAEWFAEDVLKTVEAWGCRGQIDFLYMPRDFRLGRSFGECFFNAISVDEVLSLWAKMDGKWLRGQQLRVHWATKVQGLDALIEKYRNFSIMHSSVPWDAKPLLLTDGLHTPFPPPTRKLTKPRLRPPGK
ncbi:ML1 [Symbiodinium natans]|uniref:ML1 protein n=1 Tax=Symbiodinium natans TaxID=878477 RepID=A0A812IGX6_9DINO|nr:ML1 [Symbiodinium natans]